MGILDGKKLVITGVLTDASLAYGVAQVALEEGAEIVLTGAGRAMSLTRRTARKLDPEIPVFDDISVGWANYQIANPEFVVHIDEVALDDERIGCDSV